MRKLLVFLLLTLGIIWGGSWVSARGQTGDCDLPGCVDISFGGGWVVYTDWPTSTGLGNLALQNWIGPDSQPRQRIIAMGGPGAFMAYNTDGTVDKCFGDPSGCNSGIVPNPTTIHVEGFSDFAVQPDNAFVVAGTAHLHTFKFLVARYTRDGLQDSSFGQGASYVRDGFVLVPFDAKPNSESVGRSIALQSDGKIIASGTYMGHLGVVRLLPTGLLDPSFGKNGMFVSSSAFSCSGGEVAIQRVQGATGIEERIVVVGSNAPPLPKDAPKGTRNPGRNCLLRLLPNGTVDATFGSDGMVRTDFFGTEASPLGGGYRALAIDEQTIVAVGYARYSSIPYDWQMVIGRYDINGNLDLTFNGTGKVASGYVDGLQSTATGCEIQDGKVRVVGNLQNTELSTVGRLAIWRYNENGTPDTNFGFSGLVNTTIESDQAQGSGMVRQGPGLFIVSGTALRGGVWRAVIGRFYE